MTHGIRFRISISRVLKICETANLNAFLTVSIKPASNLAMTGNRNVTVIAKKIPNTIRSILEISTNQASTKVIA